MRVVACRSVRLRLKTSSDDALAGSANLDSTTGAEGEEVFPTGFMAPRDTKADEPNEVVFQYLPRRGDNCSWAGANAGLQYVDEFALEVLCAVSGAGGACDSRLAHPAAEIHRPGEHAAAADAARRGGVHGPDSNGAARCARVPPRTTRGLLGTTPVLVDAVF